MKIISSAVAIVMIAVFIFLIMGVLGAFPHVDIQDGRYEININGSIDTVDVENYKGGFIVIDNGIPINFELYDLTKYYSDSTLYSMAFTNKRNNFVLLNKDIIITFKKI